MCKLSLPNIINKAVVIFQSPDWFKWAAFSSFVVVFVMLSINRERN